MIARSKCEYVFTHPRDPGKPLGGWILEVQMGRLRRRIQPHADAGLRALRHTFLTEAGQFRDPFTLQYVAGHDTIKTTMRDVHPREETVRKLFVRLGGLERPWAGYAGSVQNRVQLETAFAGHSAKSLVAGSLQCAEVVELADTPSKSAELRVFSKFRVINQVASKSDTYPPYLTNHS